MGTSTLIAGPMPKIGRTELARISVPEATRPQRPRQIGREDQQLRAGKLLACSYLGPLPSAMR